MKSLFRLIRWWHELLATLPFLALFFLLRHYTSENGAVCNFLIGEFILVCVCVQLLMAAGFIFNDLIDNDIDKINKPDKYIIGREISYMGGIRLFAVFSLCIFSLTSYIVINIFFEWIYFALSVYILSVLYSLFLKKLPLIGNITISALASVIPLVLLYFPDNCLFSINNIKATALVYLYSMFSFSVILPREISLDIEDVQGDKSGGRQTLPVLIGIRQTKILVIAMIITGMIFSGYVIVKYPFFKVPYLLVDSLLIIYLIVFSKSTQKKHYKLSRNLLWIIMIMGLIGFAISTV